MSMTGTQSGYISIGLGLLVVMHGWRLNWIWSIKAGKM